MVLFQLSETDRADEAAVRPPRQAPSAATASDPPAAESEVNLQLALAVVAAAVDIHRAGGIADAVLAARGGVDARCYTVLRLIRAGCRYPSQIAEAMDLPRSAITRALQSLARDRHIVSALDRDDSRRTRLALTPLGDKMFEKATRALGDWLVPAVSGLEEGDLATFFRVVTAITTEPPDLGARQKRLRDLRKS